MNNFIQKTVGRCLTEYTRSNYNDIVNNYAKFVLVSQFDKKPNNITDLDFKEGYGYPKQFNEPVCHTGTILFGVECNGSLTELKSIIDSSD